MLAVAYALAGEKSKAQETAKEVNLHVRQDQPVAYVAARLYIALNENDKALDMLAVRLRRETIGARLGEC